MDDLAWRAPFLSDRWWQHTLRRCNPFVAALLAITVAAAVLQRVRGAGAPQQCRVGACCTLLQAQVESHVALVHRELQAMVALLCPAEPALHVPSPWEQARGDVNVPSCARLRETGLEAYYGNLNMLLVEAWLGKILPALSLRHVEAPKAELITLHADGLMGGAIYVQQLRLPTGAAAPAAMMLGSARPQLEPFATGGVP